MPHYDYKCPECGHIQEEFHKMGDKPRIKCEECGKNMELTISTTQRPIFKGGGFYETDYRKPANKNKSVLKAIREHAPDDQLELGGVDRKDL